MAIYQPSNITPSTFAGITGSTIDADDAVEITWQVNGNSAMTAYQINIYKANAFSTLVYSSVLYTLDEPFYPNDRKGNANFYVATPGNTWADWGLQNGNTYKMKITQYWGNDIAPEHKVEQYSESVFLARTKPTLTIDDIPETITSVAYNFSATYVQPEGDPINWVRWTLTNTTTGETLIDTGAVNTAELAFDYNTFLPDNSYEIKVTVETANGVETTDSASFAVSYTVEATSSTLTVIPQSDNSNLVVWAKATDISGTASPESGYTISDSAITLDDNATVTWDTVDNDDMDFPAPYSVGYSGQWVIPPHLIGYVQREGEGLGNNYYANSQMSPDGTILLIYGESQPETPFCYEYSVGANGALTYLADIELPQSAKSIASIAFSPSMDSLAVEYAYFDAIYRINNYKTAIYKIDDTDIEYLQDLSRSGLRYAQGVFSPDGSMYISTVGISVPMPNPGFISYTIGIYRVSGTTFTFVKTFPTLEYKNLMPNFMAFSDDGNLFFANVDAEIMGGTYRGRQNGLSIYTVTGENFSFNKYVQLFDDFSASNIYDVKSFIPSPDGETVAMSGTVFAGAALSTVVRKYSMLIKYDSSFSYGVWSINFRITKYIEPVGDILGYNASGTRFYIKTQQGTAYSITEYAVLNGELYYLRDLTITSQMANAINSASFLPNDGMVLIGSFSGSAAIFSPETPSTGDDAAILSINDANIQIVNQNGDIVLLENDLEVARAEIPPAATTITLSFSPSRFAVYSSIPGRVLDTHIVPITLDLPNIESVVISGKQTCDWIYATANTEQPYSALGLSPYWDDSTYLFADFAEGLQAGTLSTGGNVKSAIFRIGDGKLINLGEFPSAITQLKDYGVTFGVTYQYRMYYVSSGKYSALTVSDTVRRRYPYYTLVEARQDANDPSVYHAIKTWDFRNNISTSGISNNSTPNFLQNFTKYPVYQPSSQLSRSGTLTALIGSTINGKYSDSIEQMNELFGISASVNQFFLRDMKGNMYMVRPGGAITQTIATIDELQEVTVSIPWREDGDFDGISVIQLPTDDEWSVDSDANAVQSQAEYPYYMGLYNFTPKSSSQQVNTKNRILTENIVINGVPTRDEPNASGVGLIIGQ